MAQPSQPSQPDPSPPSFAGYQSPPQQAAPAPAPSQPRADAAFVGVLSVIVSLLAARLLLLLAVIGAFTLAFRAADNTGLAVLVAYCVLTVLPLTALDIVTHQRGGR